jgi:ABC-type transport system involved in cytochrome bd biosynthesis fused ATPase/permease subunit
LFVSIQFYIDLVLEPSVNGWVTEQIIVYKNFNFAVGFLFFFWLVYCLINFLKQIYDTRVFASIYTDLATILIDKHIQKNTETSVIVSHSSLIYQFRTFLEYDLTNIMRTLINFGVSTFLLLVINWQMGLLAVASIPIVYFFNQKLLEQIAKNYVTQNDMYEKFVDTIDSKNLQTINQYFQTRKKLEIKISDLSAFNFRTSYLLAMSSIMIGFWVYTWSSNVNISSLVASLGYLYNIFWSITGISGYTDRFASLKETYTRIKQQLPNLF